MKKNGWKAFVVVVILAIVLTWVYWGSKNQTADEGISAIRTLVESGTYTLEVTDEEGESHALGESNAVRLAQLIAASIVPAEESIESVSANIPQISVQFSDDETQETLQLIVYDKGEDTNIGMLIYQKKEYPVENCGEVLNYLAELGFSTVR